MEKYIPLLKWLSNCNTDKVTLTISEIEDIIGSKLPESAYRHRAWWANDKSHTQAIAWMDAGYYISDCSALFSNYSVGFSRNNI